MKRFLTLAAVLAFCGSFGQSTPVEAQGSHSDIRFKYVDGKISLMTDVPSIGTGVFPVDGFFAQFTNNPGFASEADVGDGIQSSDLIVYNVLDNLFFWNGTSFAEPAGTTQIRIDNNGSADTTVNSSSGLLPGSFSPLSNSIGQADSSGDFHSHVDFYLEPTAAPPAYGAYGIKIALSTSATGIADSSPFFMVFNFGLDSQSMDEAVAAFAGLLTPGLAGDFDLDNDVDGQDFLLWQRGMSPTPLDLGDLADWQMNYGTVQVQASLGTVPEPNTQILAALAALSMFLRKRRECVARTTFQLT